MTSKRVWSTILISAASLLALDGCFEDESTCITDADCGPSYRCISSTCQPKVSSDPSGSGGTVVSKCFSSSECQFPKETCQSGACQPNPNYKPECTKTADCASKGSDYICQNDKCVKQASEPKDIALSFDLAYGSNMRNFALTDSWRTVLPGYTGKGKLYALFCAQSDIKCDEPITLLELGTAQGYDPAKTPIQAQFGPRIQIERKTLLNAGLSIGTPYKMMVLEDSEISQALDLDVQHAKSKNFSNDVTEWGGYASETDMLLVAKGAKINGNEMPEPSAWDVTLTSGETDLTAQSGQKLYLSHYYERDISIVPTKESAGHLVVAVDGGVRAIDLTEDGFPLIPAAKDSKNYTFQLVDESNNDLSESGSVCGLVHNPGDSTLWVLFTSTKPGEAGFAVPFDGNKLTQIGTKRVIFPSKSSETNDTGTIEAGVPCKGVISDQNLVVSNWPGPDAQKGGVWSAHVNSVLVNGNDVTAHVYTQNHKEYGDLFKAGFYAMTIQDGVLYEVPKPSQDSKAICPDGHACVFQLTIDRDGALTPRKDASGYIKLDGGLLSNNETEPASGQMLRCDPNVTTAPGLASASQQAAGKAKWLFISRCLSMKVYDITGNGSTASAPAAKEINFAASGPNAPLSNALYGQFMYTFSLSPDAQTLWAVPANKSPIMNYMFVNESTGYVSYNRMAAMPIDLTGDIPRVSSEWTSDNLDGFEGKPDKSVDNYETPAADPGLDLTFYALAKYIVSFSPSLQGATPMLTVTAPKIAVTNTSLWMGNTTAKGNAGFGKMNDFAVYDFKQKTGVLFPRTKYEKFYKVWTNGLEDRRPFGYPMNPANDNDYANYGIAYINTKYIMN